MSLHFWAWIFCAKKEKKRKIELEKLLLTKTEMACYSGSAWDCKQANFPVFSVSIASCTDSGKKVSIWWKHIYIKTVIKEIYLSVQQGWPKWLGLATFSATMCFCGVLNHKTTLLILKYMQSDQHVEPPMLKSFKPERKHTLHLTGIAMHGSAREAHS